MIKQETITILTICTFIFLCGCSQKGPAVQYVEGTVQYGDAPLDKGTITFHPVTGGEGLPAFGQIDENGFFRLTALQGGKNFGGTLPGNYKVTVVREKDEPAGMKNIGGQMFPYFESLIPTRYNDPEKSGLTAEIKKGKNQFEFVLEKTQ